MKVAAINDLSGFGKCSLIADISVLSSMGVEVNPVPTALFTAQTGFHSFYMHDTKDMVRHCTEEWKKMEAEFDGILTGYIPYEKEADYVLDFVETFNKKETVLLVDPVMGDRGECYSNYSDGLLSRIKKMVSIADIITPNLTELCILAGVDAAQIVRDTAKGNHLKKIENIANKVRAHDKQSVVVTGIFIENDKLCNMVVHEGGTNIIECSYNGRGYSGTGDLFAASLLGNVLNGKNITDAVSDTTEFINKAISATKEEDGNYGTGFEKILGNSNF
ncbi:bifunctional hydroxymethylpyrimidine kinase/phosphomethylpyrimidine kinase [Butyrivibrio sp. XPD2002]|uniref:bifunctional hydroxymethylpyrimidine kinase/phosphomethylpyrimidine kinase n=1 Tax=Butyrivibrio sp. XPD2002 TaxID=1280665 RepID=UPI0004016F9E|nr:bifunctional hydroxymethylpyrimidine kinase/phosphomethylpyrimidine kinase [Butyrivibrio sp. XPD2002]